MSSLHDLNMCNTYARWAKTLWRRWKAGHNAVVPLTYRTNFIRRCTRGLLRQISLPFNATVNVLNGVHEGEANIRTLTIGVTGPINDDDIELSDFIEIFQTAYHEARHLEQYYRVVQGVENGYIPWPDKYFENSVLIKQPTTGAEYSQRLGWNAVYCQHAITNAANLYNNFSNSTPLDPPCNAKFSATPDRLADNWTRVMKAFIDEEASPYKSFMYGEGAMDAAKHIIDRIGYRESAADYDAEAIEAQCKTRLRAQWNPYNDNITPP